MVVRNVVRSPVRAVVQSVFGEGESFHPFQLFTSGAQGAWYDPSDFSTLYQDAAGTTPVTAVEQPVRLMLDRSRGLVLGSELGDPALLDKRAGTDGTVSRAGGVITFTNGTASLSTGISQLISGLTIGRTYIFRGQIRFVSGVAPLISLRDSSGGGGSALLTSSGNSSTTFAERVLYWVATATSVHLTYQASLGSVFEVLEAAHSFRELPGNHAVAPNDASRPVLRSRYNLLTRSEEFDNGAWNKLSGTTITPNVAVAPDGTMTADRVVALDAATGDRVIQSVSIINATVTASIWLKGENSDIGKIVEITAKRGGGGAFAGNSVQHTLTAEWVRVSVSFSQVVDNTQAQFVIVSPPSNSATDVLVWGAQLQTAADHAATGGAYQRVGSATDYDTGPPWRPYLAFDGSDDSMSTSSIDFSGTDKMTVFAGVTKLSDATQGLLAELTSSSASNNGAFTLLAPDTPNDYAWASKGTTRVFPVANGFDAPITNVLTGIGDIGGDVATLRVNGVQAVTNTDDQGTGNYANAALFIGRRNNASLPFNGRLTSLIVLGRTATAAEISATEQWIAGKTGVSL